MTDLDRLRYPVGRAPRETVPLDLGGRAELIDILELAPMTLRVLVKGLTNAQLDTPYRPGGWTIRQVIHHLPDSHMNAYVRMKLAATEDAPAVKAYEESLWAELPEAKSAPVEMSLDLLDALHRRWVAFLRALPDAEFQKTYSHPQLGSVTMDSALRTYAWHCRHHAAHVRNGIEGSRR
jgi:hypothetical protein